MCARVLKCLIPNSVVPQEAVVRGLVWLGVGKIPISTQVSTNYFISCDKNYILHSVLSQDKNKLFYFFIFTLLNCTFLTIFLHTLKMVK